MCTSAVGTLVPLDRHRVVPLVAGEDGDRRGADRAGARERPGCARSTVSGSWCRARPGAPVAGKDRCWNEMRFSGSREPVTERRRFCRLRVDEPGAEEQQEAQGNLRRHQALAQEQQLGRSAGDGADSVLERLPRIEGARPQRRQQAEATPEQQSKRLAKANVRIRRSGGRLDEPGPALGRDKRKPRVLGEGGHADSAIPASPPRKERTRLLNQELAHQ